MKAMEGVAKEDGADQVLLFVADILKEEATPVPNDLVKKIAEASFGAKVSGDSVVLPGIKELEKADHPRAEALTVPATRTICFALLSGRMPYARQTQTMPEASPGFADDPHHLAPVGHFRRL